MPGTAPEHATANRDLSRPGARSLRVQLFVGILVLLLGAGAAVMLSSRDQVEHALVDAEMRSAVNVLGMIELQVANRYGELLQEKRRIVDERRARLEHLSLVVVSALEAHVRAGGAGSALAAEPAMTALEFLRDLRTDSALEVIALSREGEVLALAGSDEAGRNLGALADIKGRSLPAAVHEDITRMGRAYVIFDDTAATDGTDGRRFAYFVDVPGLDFYLGVSDRIGDVESLVEAGVDATTRVLARTLQQISVIDTGFVFIFDERLSPVTPPAEWAAALLTGREARTGRPVLELFREVGREGSGQGLRYVLADAGKRIEMEAYVSFFRPLGWYLVSTVPASELVLPADRLVQRQGAIFGLVLLVALLLAWLFALRLTGPLRDLASYAIALPRQDFTCKAGRSKQLLALERNRSEVGGLARTFGFMEDELRAKIVALVATTREKERIESELTIARDIQQGMLPKVFPPFPDKPQIDLHARLHSARHVGGDLFDFYLLDDRHLLFTVGDVADKGVPSALFMAITKTLVKSASGQDKDPVGIMNRVNHDLSLDNPGAMFVTLFVGILDLATGRIDYVNAGQNPPLLMPASRAPEFLRAVSGPPAGAMEGVSYRPLSLWLAPGDSLLVYTDGVTEAMSMDRREYGNDRLVALCKGLRGAGAEVVVDTVLSAVSEHAGGAPQSDDLTLLCLRWRQSPDPTTAERGRQNVLP